MLLGPWKTYPLGEERSPGLEHPGSHHNMTLLRLSGLYVVVWVGEQPYGDLGDLLAGDPCVQLRLSFPYFLEEGIQGHKVMSQSHKTLCVGGV